MTTHLDQAIRDTVNGLRADLHEPTCEGMDQDGNWLGPCSCAEQEAGMPPIIWSEEAHSRWMEALDQIPGYGVRVVVLSDPQTTPSQLSEVTLQGAIYETGRDESGIPTLTIELPGRRRIALSSQEVVSVYIY